MCVCVSECGEASPSPRSCGSLSPCDPLAVTDRQTQFRLAHQSTCNTSHSHCGRKCDALNGKHTVLPLCPKKDSLNLSLTKIRENLFVLPLYSFFSQAFYVSVFYCTHYQRQSSFCVRECETVLSQSAGILVHFMVQRILQNLLKILI